jgi:hypothetical protein
MPKRLITAVVLVTLALLYIVPSFYNDIKTMELGIFHYLLIGMYGFLVINFYRLALADIKDRWK